MQDSRITIIGGGLLTSKIAAMYLNMIPEVEDPWWLCEAGKVSGVQFVNSFGQINYSGGDPLAEYGIRPVFAVHMDGIHQGDTVELIDRRSRSTNEFFTCIWTMGNEDAMIFCDRIICTTPFRTNGGTDYRGSDAEKAVLKFMSEMDGRLFDTYSTVKR